MNLKILSVFLSILGVILIPMAVMAADNSKDPFPFQNEIPEGFTEVFSHKTLATRIYEIHTYMPSAKECSSRDCNYCILPKFDGKGEDQSLGRRMFKIYSHPNGFMIATQNEGCYFIGGKKKYILPSTYILINTKHNIAMALLVDSAGSSAGDDFDSRVEINRVSVVEMVVLSKTALNTLKNVDFSKISKSRFLAYLPLRPYFSFYNTPSVYKELNTMFKFLILDHNEYYKKFSDNAASHYINLDLTDSEKLCKYYPKLCSAVKNEKLPFKFLTFKSKYFQDVVTEFMNNPVEYFIETAEITPTSKGNSAKFK